MKALYIKDRSSDFALVDLPTPTPGPGEILVRVEAIAICHTDIVFRSGLLTESHCFPLIPGHEFSGTVCAVGEGVTHVHVGDVGAIETIIRCQTCHYCRTRISMECEHMRELGSTVNGGYAQYCVMPERCFVRLSNPERLEAAALAEPLSNAVATVKRANIRAGETVVVIGPGAIGLLAVAVARRCHPGKIVLVGTRDTRLAYGKRMGADELVNIRKEGAEAYLINEVLQGKGADVIIDCSGALSGFELSLKLIKSYSRIIFEGFVRLDETLPFSPRILHENCSLLAVEGWTRQDFQDALNLIDSGEIDPSPLITHRLPLENWEEGFDLASTKKSEAIRVVLKPNGVSA